MNKLSCSKICSHILFLWDVLNPERVFLAVNAHLMTLSFWYTASFKYFRGLWSVWSVNLLLIRYNLNLLITYTTAKHFFSVMGYLATTPTAATPTPDVSVWKLQGWLVQRTTGIPLVGSMHVPVLRSTGYIQVFPS